MKYLLCFFFGVTSGYLLATLIDFSNDDIEKVIAVDTSLISLSDNTITQPVINISNKPIASEEAISATKQTSLITTPGSSTDELLSEKIAKLEAESLEWQLKYQRTKNKLMEVTLEKESLDGSSITDQQMVSLRDDDFAQFRRQYKGKQRDDLYEFHQQEDDLNWGYQMNVRISDFIQTHYNSDLVVLESVLCKIDSCELLVSEAQSGGWPPIMKQMRAQSWWNFTSTQSSSRFGENQKNYYYLFLSK
ncbi:MAG: hypothetical protein MJK12_00320 [Colwellia sp.]|nr:hypothetical protein [Colwellia sp.]